MHGLPSYHDGPTRPQSTTKGSRPRHPVALSQPHYPATSRSATPSPTSSLPHHTSSQSPRPPRTRSSVSSPTTPAPAAPNAGSAARSRRCHCRRARSSRAPRASCAISGGAAGIAIVIVIMIAGDRRTRAEMSSKCPIKGRIGVGGDFSLLVDACAVYGWYASLMSGLVCTIRHRGMLIRLVILFHCRPRLRPTCRCWAEFEANTITRTWNSSSFPHRTSSCSRARLLPPVAP